MNSGNTPRTDSMVRQVRSMSEYARARNLAYLCRSLERELRKMGIALNEQSERWGLYGNDSQKALKEFKSRNLE